MSRVLLLASLLCYAALPGCGGPEKELPRDVPVSTERGKDVEAAAPVPAASQPDAVKFVEKCLAAATDGHPERIERARVNRVTQQGTLLNNMRFVATTRKYAATWPDRFFFSDETSDGGSNTIAIGLRQGVLTFRRNAEAFDPGFPKGHDQLLLVDAIGQHWMPTLVPIADPKTILFGVKKQLVGKQSWDTVQAFVPNCPAYTLWFDEKTSLLGVVTYIHLEGNSRINKAFAVSDHKPVAGVQLPTRSEFVRGGETVERWTITSWEFPDQLDDSVFDQPVKK